MPPENGRLQRLQADLRHARKMAGLRRPPTAVIQSPWPRTSASSPTAVVRLHSNRQFGFNVGTCAEW